MKTLVAVLALALAAPAAAQTRCTTYYSGGFLISDCDEPERRTYRAPVVILEDEEQRAERRLLERQPDQYPKCPEPRDGRPYLCR